MQFTAGSVLKRSIRVLWDDLLPFGALALLVYSPFLALGILIGNGSNEVVIERLPGGGFEVHPPFPALLVLRGVLAFVATRLVTASVAFGVSRILRGESLAFWAALTKGFRALGSLICVGGLIALGTTLGFFALGIPGIVLTCMWYVAEPAFVLEKRGILGALSRSAALTRGHRMSMLALWLVPIFVLGALEVSLLTVDVRLGPSSGSFHVGMTIGPVIGLWRGICSAVAYHDLRVLKDGLDTEELAKIFE